MQERRESRRTPISLYVKFNVDSAQKIKHGGFTLDVSAQGIRMLSPCVLKPNSNVTMSIDIPNDPDLALAEGNVRWAKEQSSVDENGNKVFSAGIAFTSLDRQDKVYLEEYLEQYNNG